MLDRKAVEQSKESKGHSDESDKKNDSDEDSD